VCNKKKLIVKKNLHVKLLQHSIHLKSLILDPDPESGLGENPDPGYEIRDPG
jgi:hypothetical protein